MLTQGDIEAFCGEHDYDVRKSGNGRWIDQKCTADVVTVVADCIFNYGLENANAFFSTKDVWHHEYAIQNVEAIFRKPGVTSYAAKNEYDKFFQQPMEMLANAGVLKKRKEGVRNLYCIESYELLEYIALRERNALNFLNTYIEKVLKDSGIYNLFESFFNQQDKNSYENMKKGFSLFTIQNTQINGITECNRIFTKVLNPLAYSRGARGTERGVLSNNPITYDMLMYNRNNFRDLYSNKPKGMTRKEYADKHPAKVNQAYYRYQSTKAKRFLRLFNDQYRGGATEHPDKFHINDQAIHMHHIFPEAEFPEICFYLENIIALTPTQHLSYAHPRGKTQEIDNQYQHLLLLSKADRIQENFDSKNQEQIYDFENFLLVLSVGFDDDRIRLTSFDFCSIVNIINTHYSSA